MLLQMAQKNILKREMESITFILMRIWGLGANNLGAEKAKGELLFLLNSDTILIENSIKKNV
jgi:hypothetical protein